jgi:hypothetical protein
MMDDELDPAPPPADGPRHAVRLEGNATNWNRGRTGARVGVTKPTVAARKARRRKRKRKG